MDDRVEPQPTSHCFELLAERGLHLSPLNTIDSMEFLLEKMNGTRSNNEFMDLMNQ